MAMGLEKYASGCIASAFNTMPANWEALESGVMAWHGDNR